jgi:hypothetical protein
VALVAGASLLGALSLAGLADSGTDEAAGVAVAGTIPNLPGCGLDRHATDEGLGILITVRLQSAFSGGCPGGTRTALIGAVYSTRSLHLLNRVTLQAPGLPDQILPPVVDSAHHRLFVLGESFSGATPVYRYDLRAMLHTRGTLAGKTYTSLPTKPPATSVASSDQDPSGTAADSVQGVQALKAAYDPGSDSLDVSMFNPDSVASSNAVLASGDEYLAEVDGDLTTNRFFIRLGQCVIPQRTSPLPTTDPILHVDGTSPAVAVGCGYLSNLSVFDTSGSTGAGEVLTTVVSLSGGKPSAQPVAFLGKTGALGGLADPASGRIFYAVSPSDNGNTSASAQGPSAVTFDVAHTAYIGAATINSAVAASGGFAMAVGGGRLYAVGPGGVFVADAGSTPVDPGLIYPAFSCQADDAVVDGSTHRLFVTPDSSCKSYKNQQVVLDDQSDVVGATAPDPDLNTHDIAERPGVTQTTFSGRAVGIAVRARMIGGVTDLEDGATYGNYSSNVGSTNPNDNPTITPEQLALVMRIAPNSRPVLARDFSNREIDLGDISATDLDNVQANAAAVAGALDDTSASAVSEGTNVANPPVQATKPSPGATPAPPLVPGQSVPFKQAACSAPQTPDGTSAYQPAPGMAADSSHVTCSLGSSVTGSTAFYALGLDTGSGDPLVGAGSGLVTTSVTKDPQLGVVATVTSVVRGLAVGPVLIDAVTTSITCVAHGRPGTAHCTFSRSIAGVSNGGNPVQPGSCSETDSGSTGAGACQSLIAELNTLTPGKLVFSAPEPDASPDYLGGSPRGAQAVAQRDRYQELEDSLLNNDDLYTVPGLTVLYVNDTATAPSRVELQVAGGQAEAHYGINPPFSFDTGPILGIALPTLPPPETGIVPPKGVQPVLGTDIVGPGPDQPAPTITPTGVLPRLIARVWDGLALLWRSPGTALLVLALLSLMGLPLLTAWRRGRLIAELGRVR